MTFTSGGMRCYRREVDRPATDFLPLGRIPTSPPRAHGPPLWGGRW
jgi:hypothetical protein